MMKRLPASQGTSEPDVMDNLDDSFFGGGSDVEQAAIQQWFKNFAPDHGTSKAVRGRLFDNKMVIFDTVPQCLPVAMKHLEEDIPFLEERVESLKEGSVKRKNAEAALEDKRRKLTYLQGREPCHLHMKEMCVYMKNYKGTRGTTSGRRTEKCMAVLSYLGAIREEVITEYADLDQEGMFIVGTELIPALLLEMRIQIQVPAMDLTSNTDRGGMKANPLLKELRSTTEHIAQIRESLRLRIEKLRAPESGATPSGKGRNHG